MGMTNPGAPNRDIGYGRAGTKYSTNQSPREMPSSDPGDPKYMGDFPLGSMVRQTASDSISRLFHSAGERCQTPGIPVFTRASIEESVMPDAEDIMGLYSVAESQSEM